MPIDRKLYIGSSDAASLFGCSPYKSLFTLYQDKHKGFDVEIDNELIKWGNRLESAILAGFAEDYACIVKTDIGFIPHPKIKGMGCHPDGMINFVGEGGTEEMRRLYNEYGAGVIDAKNVDRFKHHNDWTDDEATAYIEVQMQHMMACTGTRWAVVAPLIGGNAMKPIIKLRNEEFIEVLEQKVTDFWAMTEEPEVDNHNSTLSTVKALHRKVDIDTALDLSGDEEAVTLAKEYFDALEARKAYDAAANGIGKLEEFLKAKLVRNKLCDAQSVKIGDYLISRSVVKRKGYTVPNTEYVTLKMEKMDDK